MAIKARVFNKQRVLFFNAQLEKYTPAQKAECFDMIFKEVRAAHLELNSYKRKRKDKAIIEAQRIARGYKRKKKTSLAEYEDKMRDALISKAS